MPLDIDTADPKALAFSRFTRCPPMNPPAPHTRACVIRKMYHWISQRRCSIREKPRVRITISKENYLKTIAEAESEGETVKAVTLTRWLHVSAPRSRWRSSG